MKAPSSCYDVGQNNIIFTNKKNNFHSFEIRVGFETKKKFFFTFAKISYSVVVMHSLQVWWVVEHGLLCTSGKWLWKSAHYGGYAATQVWVLLFP